MIESVDTTNKLDLVDILVEVLGEYEDKENSKLRLTKTAFNPIPVSDLREFYKFLVKIPDKSIKIVISRPEQMNFGNTGRKPVFTYKQHMEIYLKQFGYELGYNISLFTPSLLEATANYLGENKVKE